MEMLKINGKTVYKSVAHGPIFVLDKSEVLITDAVVADAEAEVNRLNEAIDKAKEQIGN